MSEFKNNNIVNLLYSINGMSTVVDIISLLYWAWFSTFIPLCVEIKRIKKKRRMYYNIEMFI